MKIIELVLDEDQEGSPIDAISIVSAPAIEEDFVALNSQEIKLAEVSKDKKLLMGALLVPNKPIFRKSGEEEYYIYFSKKTIEKASQLYLQNGNQNNSTLEHASAQLFIQVKKFSLPNRTYKNVFAKQNDTHNIVSCNHVLANLLNF